MRISLVAATALAACALTLPLAAAEPAVYRGIDAFTTIDNGKTYYDFQSNPIPAGFFCAGSPAFTGRLVLKGKPIETEVPGQLKGADTVIERLDDAVFDAQGVARTRIQFRALSLVSSAPIETPCGAFHAAVSLAGTQRVTAMRIERVDELGGNFVAPLAVDVRIRFTPVRPSLQARPALEMAGSFTFPGVALPWRHASPNGGTPIGAVRIDTDGDRRPDTDLAGSSNFAPGWGPNTPTAVRSCWLCEAERCHPYEGKVHCTGPVLACDGAQCP